MRTSIHPIIVVAMLLLATGPVGAQEAQRSSGAFTIDFQMSTTPALEGVPEVAMAMFHGEADHLNRVFKLKRDVHIRFVECGNVNAYFIPHAGGRAASLRVGPQDAVIVMCYELIDHFGELFQHEAGDVEGLITEVEGAAKFFFYHELGHALINTLDLATTAKEEDAVDNLATLLLKYGEAEHKALAGAKWFRKSWQAQTAGSTPFWDEHSLDMQRFYNIICLIYGSNPTKFAAEAPQLKGRAHQCPAEFQRIDKAWNRLLQPHLQP